MRFAGHVQRSVTRSFQEDVADLGVGITVNMKIVIACLLLILSTVIAADTDTVDQIIAKDGLFVYSDGSSFFALQKGGRFESGPMEMCGQTIEGTWTKDRDGKYVVKGKWGWMNGKSAANDFRTMSIYLFNPHAPSLDQRLFSTTIVNPVKIYKVYAIIESVEKDIKSQDTTEQTPAASSK